MGFVQWVGVLDTVGGLVQMARRFRRGESLIDAPASPLGGPIGQIEARLAGVVVAALKEAFDRDSARLELERTQIEADRRRAEHAARDVLVVGMGGSALPAGRKQWTRSAACPRCAASASVL